ncbi:Arc family DNA-binding protein [Listeria monocytogenes]|nr:Arc family DNA-binding protein [Listeria monocytogenes]
MSKTSYPLRLDDDLMEKLKLIAEKNSRSLNKQLEFIIKNYLVDYEEKNGEVTLHNSHG